MLAPSTAKAAAAAPEAGPAPGAAAAPAGSLEPGSSPWLGQSPAQSELFRRYQFIDRFGLSMLGAFTGGQSPATLAGAFADWWVHLLASPAKQIELAQFGAEQALKALSGDADVQALPQDKRFADAAWQTPPFNHYARAFLLGQQWWQRATTGVPGVSRHHEDMVSFGARQWLDLAAPSNRIATNPVVLNATLEQRGANLWRGALHAVEDTLRDAAGLPPAGTEGFVAGKDVAVTPGRVILRNRLIELIQYEPATPKTHAEPVLVVPAWIMKYYILDLSPSNSLIRHLVEHGYTVFAISWNNPGPDDRDLGLADYARLGVRAALDAIATVMPGARTHALGYCLGGTLLAIVAAALGREKSSALKTLTLLAAQTDFTDPGELSLFIDEGQVNFLENVMWPSGTLDERHMKGAFRMLRSADLIWSYRIVNYLLGERRPATDLMAWNADGTRLPLHALGIPAHAVPAERARARPVRARRCADQPGRHRRADLLGRRGAGPCRAVALGVQAAPADRCRPDLRADRRRAQRRHRQPAGAAEVELPHPSRAPGRAAADARRMARQGDAGAGLVVDRVAAVARPPLVEVAARAAADGRAGRRVAAA